MDDNITYKHKIRIQPRFSDFDVMGHVNNTVFLSYFDIGKVSYFEAVWGEHIDWREVGLVVARLETDFLEPILMDEQIEVNTAVTAVGYKSLTISQKLITSQSRAIKSYCKTIMAGFDADLNQVNCITDKCIEALSAYEGRKFERIRHI